MIKTCVADNIPTIHFGIKNYFASHPKIKIVSSVLNFEELKKTLTSRRIDVLVLDLELDGLNGIVNLKWIVEHFPNLKVFIYTNLNEILYGPSAMNSGSRGYLKKSASLVDLEKTIQVVMKGELIISKQLKESLLIGKETYNFFVKLSGRESEVLRHLCNGKKNHEISSILDISDKTISTYKTRLYKKMGVKNLVDLVAKSKSLDIF